MNPSDFFVETEDQEWDLKGLDPWRRAQMALDARLVELLRQAPQEPIDDLDAAYALAQLAHDELVAMGTGGGERLSDEEMTAVLRCLRSVLRRHGEDFDPPFRDFQGFHGYWSSHGMSGSGGWAARRGYLNELFSPLFSRLDELGDESATAANVRGVGGQLRNLIFASSGPKPDIVLRDAINNVIEVTRNAEYCLFYDRPLADSGLTWGELADWWREKAGLADEDDVEVGRDLYRRLHASVADNEAEELVLRTYCQRYAGVDAATVPVLLPQVYLHYDPLTRSRRRGRPSVLARERMDFLLLLPGRMRVVIEVDGKQHYAQGDLASPRLYAEMMAEDRRLRLRGYEVFRFGGIELVEAGKVELVRGFFDDLLARYI